MLYFDFKEIIITIICDVPVVIFFIGWDIKIERGDQK